MGTFVSDSFTDTDYTNLTSHTGETGASWTIHPLYGGFSIQSNTAYADASPSAAYASGTPAGAEYDISLKVVDISSGRGVGCFGRMSTSANTGYLTWANGTTNYQLYQVISGSYNLLASYSQVPVNGDVLKLSITDAAKKVYVNDIEIISHADNTITSAGRAGFRTYVSGASLDDYLATEADGGTVFNDSIAETATLLDTNIVTVLFPVTIGETTALQDSLLGANVSSASLTETASLLESLEASQTLGATFEEIVELLDSATVIATFNPTIAEIATLQDSNSVVTTFNINIAETLDSLDSYLGSVIFSATITETLIDPDSYAAEVSVVINESVSGTDSYSVTVNYVTTLTETASVVDTINTSWTCNATLTEIQTLVDSITAYISGEEPTSFDLVSLKSFITRMLPTNSKITTSITKNSKITTSITKNSKL